MPVGEFELINRFFKRESSGNSDIVLGIGDDAALITQKSGFETVISVDTLVEGIHFPHDSAPGLVASRALRVNLSDLAAMAATPTAFTLALTLPNADEFWLQEFSASLAEVAEQFDISLVGGDTTRGPLSTTVSVFGEVASGRALRRSGAQPGDDIWVTGTLGDAASVVSSGDYTADNPLYDRFWNPTPRVSLLREVRDLIHSGLDISDGLVGDLAHICRLSKVSALVEVDLLPLSPALREAHDLGLCRDFALGGGDDYEICFTAPRQNRASIQAIAQQQGVSTTVVGRTEKGSGVRCVDEYGNEVIPQSGSYTHFQS